MRKDFSFYGETSSGNVKRCSVISLSACWEGVKVFKTL